MFATNAQKTALKTQIIRDIVEGRAAMAYDMDQTCANDTPGNHDKLPVNQELTDIFNYLTQRTHGAVAILTGRPSIYLETVMPEFKGIRATENGAMIRVNYEVLHKQNGHDIEMIKAIFRQECIDRLKAEIMTEGNTDNLDLNALSVEDHKEQTLTLQFTGVCGDIQKREKFARRLVELANDLLHGEALLQGYYEKHQVVRDNSYIEILPKGLDKGIALRNISKMHSFQGKTIYYAGDSRSADESAMIIAQGTGGKGLGVTADAPDLCDIRFTDYKEHVAFWADIVQTLKTMENAPKYSTLAR